MAKRGVRSLCRRGREKGFTFQLDFDQGSRYLGTQRTNLVILILYITFLQIAGLTRSAEQSELLREERVPPLRKDMRWAVWEIKLSSVYANAEPNALSPLSGRIQKPYKICRAAHLTYIRR